jgi:HD-GYP domain-containing protein (c-di-GMP phosphodiesterase class II)
MTTRSKSNGRSISLVDKAKALAIVLREEFDVPFVCYEADAGSLVWFQDVEGLDDELRLEPVTVMELVADGESRVTPLPKGRYLLALPLYDSGKPILVAAAAIPALAPPGPGMDQEQIRLQRWLQACSNRMRASEQLLSQRRNEDEQNAQAKTTWEVILTVDHLIRHTRIHKNPIKNAHRILQAAFELLQVENLIWVPQDPDAQVIIQGEPCLASLDSRQLSACLTKNSEIQGSGPYLCNEVQEKNWGQRFPKISNLLAFGVSDQTLVGWIIALNKQQARRAAGLANYGGNHAEDGASKSITLMPFRRSDAAMLTPFVALFEQNARNSTRYQDLKNLLVGLTRSLTSALDAKDTYTYGHSERVARIAVELGRELGMEGDELGDIYLAGLLHDIGKIGISDAVLGKRDSLTPEEMAHIKQHVTIGYSILADLRQIRNVLPGVLYHHERYDGTGYPDGLAGEAIPLVARILAVADAFDAMSTTRPYRLAMPSQKAEETLVQGADKQWDKRIVDAFLRCRLKIHAIRQRGVGSSLRHAVDGVLRKEDSSVVSIEGSPIVSDPDLACATSDPI